MTKLLRLPFLLLVLIAATVFVPGSIRAESAPAEPKPTTARRTILFYGDSLTAGYGLDDPTETAFPARIQQKIDAAHLPYHVVNAGLSGETSSGGLRRIDWVLRQPVDVFVLELGGNDGLRGLPLDLLRANLQKIFDHVRAKYPHARLVLAGMQMPTSMGDYADQFRALYAPLAAANHAALIPFLLEGVGAHPELNQADGIHPNPAGHALVADTVWSVLQPLLIASP